MSQVETRTVSLRLIFEGSSNFILFLFIYFGGGGGGGGEGFSKIGLPSLLCIRNHIHAQTMFINIINRHLVVAKDCTMKTLFANFSE